MTHVVHRMMANKEVSACFSPVVIEWPELATQACVSGGVRDDCGGAIRGARQCTYTFMYSSTNAATANHAVWVPMRLSTSRHGESNG